MIPEQITIIISDGKINPFPYLYRLQTWGGFYNKEYQKIHKQERLLKNYRTPEDRELELNLLKSLEKENGWKSLAHSMNEGFEPFLNQPIVLHRVTRFEGNNYYSTYEVDQAFAWSIETAFYHMKWKWYPGFNDYPMGEDFDYENNHYEVVEE